MSFYHFSGLQTIYDGVHDPKKCRLQSRRQDFALNVNDGNTWAEFEWFPLNIFAFRRNIWKTFIITYFYFFVMSKHLADLCLKAIIIDSYNFFVNLGKTKPT